MKTNRKKTVLVSFRLQKRHADALAELAKLAGVSVDDVIRVAIAREVMRDRAQEFASGVDIDRVLRATHERLNLQESA